MGKSDCTSYFKSILSHICGEALLLRKLARWLPLAAFPVIAFIVIPGYSHVESNNQVSWDTTGIMTASIGIIGGLLGVSTFLSVRSKAGRSVTSVISITLRIASTVSA